MPLPRIVPAILGMLAVLSTSAVLAMNIVLGYTLRDTDHTVVVAGILSSVLDALVLLLVVWLVASTSESQAGKGRWRTFNHVWFGASLLLCVVAAAASIAAVVRLRKASSSLPSHILGSTATGFLTGSSVALGLSFALQLMFLVIHHVTSRMDKNVDAQSTSDVESRWVPQPHVKSVPYHHTSPLESKRGSFSMSPPGSSAGYSVTGTMTSMRSSLSHAVRPMTSKTRLLARSQRSSTRQSSVDSIGWHERSSVAEDGFDTWDTSCVDTHTRQTVLGGSPPIPARFLETIPASPAVSRSPSPGTPIEPRLPPMARQRSRSDSPASVRSIHSQAASLSRPGSAMSEAHIHPLFRSDSPTPPPLATPGTVVTAAPGAGQVIIPDRKTLNRMRSGSLPAISSPLSRQGSLDDFHRREASCSATPSISPGLAEEPEEEEEQEKSDSERKMTPPIPEWVLSAGTRLSLAVYNSRKLRHTDGAEVAAES